MWPWKKFSEPTLIHLKHSPPPPPKKNTAHDAPVKPPTKYGQTPARGLLFPPAIKRGL